MDWTSIIDFKIFQRICGKGTLRNAVIVTNMWGEAGPQIGEAREAELMSEGVFFRPVLDNGARFARNENTVTSAQNIIRLVLDSQPLPPRIQEALVNEHKDISKTNASEELNREINAQIKKHKDEMRVVKKVRVLKGEVCILRRSMRSGRRCKR